MSVGHEACKIKIHINIIDKHTLSLFLDFLSNLYYIIINDSLSRLIFIVKYKYKIFIQNLII